MTACTYPAIGLFLSGLSIGGIVGILIGFGLFVLLDARAQRKAGEEA